MSEKILSPRQAKKAGYSHHGHYYGIPVYMGEDKNDIIVSGKYAIFDPIIDMLIFCEKQLWSLIDPTAEFMPSFTATKRIQ